MAVVFYIDLVVRVGINIYFSSDLLNFLFEKKKLVFIQVRELNIYYFLKRVFKMDI